MNSRAAINAYANVGLGTDIMSADPHKLTSMLFEGALLAIARARHALARNEPATKGQFISKAIAIIGEGLHASLDKDVGGELARNLSALYDYMVKRLVHTGSTLRPRSVEFKGAVAAALEAHVWPLLDSGRLRPVVDKVFPLDQAGNAQAYMESSAHRGKIILAVS